MGEKKSKSKAAAPVPEKKVKAPAKTAPVTEARMIPVADVFPSPANTRAMKDAEVKSLAADIAEHGLLHPVTVRPHPTKKGKFELVAGERRWMAVKSIGQKAISANVRTLTDEQAYEITVAENLQREDLTPMEEAAGLQLLIDKGMSTADLAAHLGRTVNWVARRAKLLNLSDKWKKAAAGKHPGCKREISIGALELVSRFDKNKQDEIFDDMSLWDGCTTAKMEEALEKVMLTISSAPWKSDDIELNGCACSSCEKRTGLQPDLFGDATGKISDKCLDKKCFEEKREAFVLRKVKQMREDNPATVLVRQSYNVSTDLEKEAVMVNSVRVAKKSTPGAVPALKIDGPEAGKTIYVVPDEKTQATSAEKVGKTMEEKREGLRIKRIKEFLSRMIAILRGMNSEGSDDSDLGEECYRENRLAHARGIGDKAKVRMAVVYGSLVEQFTELKDRIKASADMADDAAMVVIAAGAMQNMAQELEEMSYNPGAVKLEEIFDACEFSGIEAKTIWEQVEKDIPEPKSWAKDDEE